MITRDDLSAFRAELVLCCKICLDECPSGVSPRDWSRVSFGSFRKPEEPGIYLQLWCDRHDCNITTIHVSTDQWSHLDDIPLRVEGTSEGAASN